jgi:hypothetical protein
MTAEPLQGLLDEVAPGGTEAPCKSAPFAGPEWSYRVETIATIAIAAQTAITPARPVKIAPIARSGTPIPIAPSTISFW